MTIEKIRSLLQASPFQSFEVHTPDGRAFHVPHPDFAMLSGTGRLLHVARPKSDEEDIIDKRASGRHGEPGRSHSYLAGTRGTENPQLGLLIDWPPFEQ